MNLPIARIALFVFVFALLFIIFPFILLENTLEEVWKLVSETTSSNLPAFSGIVFLTLALDIFLPVPSSLVNTAAGAIAGFFPGFITSLAGLTAGGLIGYALGRRLGPTAISRFAPPQGLRELEKGFAENGIAALLLTRAVPVLAETSVLLAGAAKMKIRPFLLTLVAANTVIAGLYSAAGAYAIQAHTWIPLFLALIAIPFIALQVFRHISRSSPHP